MFICLVARAQRLDDSWLISAPNKLGIPEADLRHYATDGDLSLTSLIHLARHQFSQFGLPWRDYEFSKVLEAASKFNVQDTSPDLQHEFCALWNQIVLKAQNDNDRRMATWILGPIRNVYVALHEGTDAAPTQFSASNCDWDPVLYNPTSYPRSDVSSSSVPVPPHVVECPTDMPPLDDFHPRTAHPTPTGSLSIPVTSPDPATADVSHIIPRPTVTSATSTSTPLSSTSPPATIALQHNPDPLAPSDPRNHPSSTSSPMLDNTLPTGLSLTSHSSMTRSDPSLSFTECPRSAIVPNAPSASTGSTSAPDLGAAVKDDGSPKAGARKDEDIHSEPPSAICAIHVNTMATLDLPQPSPSPLSFTDTNPTIAGPSLRESNAECTGDLPLDPLHCPYDIV
ncbi:hypothetical protein EDB83DRAFT_1767861 [Lactarius deliciosus]|nr:hypothetical protein EDB83DRAFT_1767861 [Lactarius deliciosus]